MKLQSITLNNLKISPLNVRKSGAKSVDDLIPSIRSLGIIQPLLVRPNCEGYEIVAGQRRFRALQTLAQEQAIEPVPCLVMDKDDDAKALEASLAENIARLPMNEVDQYKAFARLIKQGVAIEDVAAHFGVTERLVRQRLAIANLHSPILTAYKKGDIEAATIRLLTMASNTQQKAWWALYKDENEYAPEGHGLKRWLFGGSSIPTYHALFDLEDYSGAIVSDLFGDEAYFADTEIFWQHQNTAIAEAKARYLAEGWETVTILDVGEYFLSYDYVDTAKEDGGQVYIAISHDGAVTCNEGQLSRKAINARDKAQQTGDDKPAKPEITKVMQNYLDLQRHSAVRAELLNHQGIALRLAVAHMIAGSELWTVYADPQKASNEAIEQALNDNPAETLLHKQRQAIAELLGLTKGCEETLMSRKADWGKSLDVHDLFAKLIDMEDENVMQVLTFVMAETLSNSSALVEALGVLLKVELDETVVNDTFFALLRDKETINAILKQVAGKKTADANITATAKVQKGLIQEALTTRKQSWTPNYLTFPMTAYTKRGGIRAIANWNSIKKHYA